MQNLLALELLVDWIKGDCGSILDQQESAKICRVIIVGNSVGYSQSQKGVCLPSVDAVKETDTLISVQQLDDILFDLAVSNKSCFEIPLTKYY